MQRGLADEAGDTETVYKEGDDDEEREPMVDWTTCLRIFGLAI